MLASEHRNEDGNLTVAQMIRIPCRSKFRIFQPFEEYRARCPRVLVICFGEHPHPIPLLTRAPRPVYSALMAILDNNYRDLPDLTPRQFIRHPSVNGFLKTMFPDKVSPSLIDVHPSLANRDYIGTLIRKAQNNYFPEGTGWKGKLIFWFVCTLSDAFSAKAS